MARFFEYLPTVLDAEQPFALGIITAIKGSSPQKMGAKALFFGDGRIHGTLGGGCLEAEIQDRARRALITGEPATFDLVLDHDFGWDDGLVCGGRVSGVILPRAAQAGELWRALVNPEKTLVWGVRDDFSIDWVEEPISGEWLYRETVAPPCALWVAGSGHVAQAVVPMAQQVDFEVTVFDDRPALANDRHFPGTTRFRVEAWEKLLEDASSTQPAFGLIVTRGHQHDALVLRNWVKRPFVFLGMIGSGRKRRLIFSEFLDRGIATETELARVACPVGLDIASQSVSEIGVSIVAQLVQERAARVYGRSRQGRGAPAVPLASESV